MELNIVENTRLRWLYWEIKSPQACIEGYVNKVGSYGNENDDDDDEDENDKQDGESLIQVTPQEAMEMLYRQV